MDTYLYDGECGSIGRQDIDKLGLVLLLHELVEVTLRAQKDLKFLGLRQVLKRADLFQEQV